MRAADPFGNFQDVSRGQGRRPLVGGVRSRQECESQADPRKLCPFQGPFRTPQGEMNSRIADFITHVDTRRGVGP